MSDSRPARLPDPLAKCPFCTTLYANDGLRGLGRKKGGEVTHATCRQCLRAMIFAVERTGSHIACVGVLTDCDAEEAVHFEKNQVITLDEVLKAHVALRK